MTRLGTSIFKGTISTEPGKDLTQRLQREEHRVHGETPTGDADVRHGGIGAGARGRRRHYKRKAAARLPQSKKEKAPTGAGAHFSTLIILLYLDRLVKDKMRYCKLLIGGTLSRLRAGLVIQRAGKAGRPETPPPLVIYVRLARRASAH